MSTLNRINDSNISVEYHVICVIDLLGQSDNLMKWMKLPSNESEAERFKQGMKYSVGTVEWFRNIFVEFFENFNKPQLSEAELGQLKPKQKETLERCRSCELSIEQFSDTFVFHAPLKNSHGDVTSTPIYRMLSASAMAMFMSLAGKTALRGAMTIGLGMLC